MKKLILLITICLTALTAQAYNPIKNILAPAGKFTVVRIYDGDTFTIVDKNGHDTYNIRIDGIDAPERRQEFGMFSRLYLERLIAGKPVTVLPTEVDTYGRTIAKCLNHEGKDLALEMLRAGMAWHYAAYNNTKSYIRAEQEARYTQQGLWCRPNPMNPQDYRNAPLSIKRKNQ